VARAHRLWLAILALLLASRLCHVGILWEGDAYPLAGARQMLYGHPLYRGIFFDKPPLLPVAYLLFGAAAGWPLRLFGALDAMLACWLAYRFARDLWTEAEGFWAAALMAFFLTFGLPSAVIPAASDLLMLAPHLAAVWMAWKRRPFWSGVLAGVAFWLNPKGVFVAAACALFDPAGIPWMVAGFGAVSAGLVGWLAATASLGPYWEQVWQWGRLYAATTPVEQPWRNGAIRTLNWAGFHSALIVAAVLDWGRKPAMEVVRWAGWIVLALAGVSAGLRFFPRYYFLLLAPLVLLAARGFASGFRWGHLRDFAILLLLIPLTRFGPAYLTALRGAAWPDTAMDRDSRAAAEVISRLSHPGDTLFIWGYRPEIYVYTDLQAATMYLDSQPLTGVPADRHLTQSKPMDAWDAKRRRVQLAASRPTIVVDGLGPYNPRLALSRFADLRGWLSRYHEVARAGQTVIYLRDTTSDGHLEQGK
jgi:Dolichyl-phosphate-mannose-protein mannosyltransferase